VSYETARFVALTCCPFWRRAVNLTGDYLQDTEARVGPNGFGPMRHVVQQLRAAA